MNRLKGCSTWTWHVEYDYPAYWLNLRFSGGKWRSSGFTDIIDLVLYIQLSNHTNLYFDSNKIRSRCNPKTVLCPVKWGQFGHKLTFGKCPWINEIWCSLEKCRLLSHHTVWKYTPSKWSDKFDINQTVLNRLSVHKNKVNLHCQVSKMADISPRQIPRVVRTSTNDGFIDWTNPLTMTSSTSKTAEWIHKITVNELITN